MQVLVKYWLGLSDILTSINQSLLIPPIQKNILTSLYQYLTDPS